MFGRTKQDQTPEAARAVDESHASSEEKKGRPTPKRKDAEAAARERARMGLDEKAVEAVKQYRFKPAMENGKPVLVELNVEVNFQIF